MKKLLGLLTILCIFIMACSFKKQYVIGVVEDYPPYVYSVGESYMGLNVDIVNEIAKERKFDYKIKKVDKTELENDLEKGNLDAVFFIQGLDDKVKYTSDYIDQEYGIGSLSDDNNIENIKSKKVGVLANSTVRMYLNSIRGEYGFAILTYKDFESIEEALKNNDIDYIVDDYRFLLYIKQRMNDFKIGEHKSDGISLKIAVNKNKAGFLNEFDTGLIDLINNGKYEEIISKYK